LGDFFRSMDVSARSKNNARATVGAFFKFGKERAWLPKDHDGIELVPKFKEKPHGIEIFTPWEIAQFLTFARPEMVPFVAIGGFAGLRSAEIERLDWAEVRLADRLIEVKAEKAKTASRRLVPITENLAKWLAPYAKLDGRVAPFDQHGEAAWLAGGGHERGPARSGQGGREEPGQGKAGEVEEERAATFVHQLPGGGHPKRGASGAGSRELAADHFRALPGTGATGGGEGLVFHRAGEGWENHLA